MKAELCRLALEKVGNPNTLINIVSRRVRQLTAGAGPYSRPMILDVTGLGAADIAMVEIIEGKLGWIAPEEPDVKEVIANKRRKKS